LAVELSVGHALGVQALETGSGNLAHLAQLAELDRLGGARLGARGNQVVLEPSVAERALLGEAGLFVETDDIIGAGGDAVAAAVAYLRLDEDGVELGLDDRVGGADLHAARLCAVLAHVAHHAPRHAAIRRIALEELHVPPVLVVEPARIVETAEEL